MKSNRITSDGHSSNTLVSRSQFKPILFSTPMVEAIEAGRKTQTRRLVKFPKDFDGKEVYQNGVFGLKYSSSEFEGCIHRLYPKYEIGDILWVREKWRKNDTPTGFPYHHYADDTIYTDRDNEKWKPSLFMPKEACRLFLQVKDIRAEQLQKITPKDAEREGIEHLGGDIWKDYMNKKCFPEFMQVSTFTRTSSFKSLWEKINGVESWEANPYVWVITFKVVECPQGFC